MNRELIKQYLDRNPYGALVDFFYLPVEVARSLPYGYGYLDPNDRQNDSPTTQEMMEIASKYNGTLEGYVITLASGREDARITFSGFSLPVSKSTAYQIKKETNPTEFQLVMVPSKVGCSYQLNKPAYRFWWD